MLDQRLNNSKYQGSLSKWIRQKIKTYHSFGEVESSLLKFSAARTACDLEQEAIKQREYNYPVQELSKELVSSDSSADDPSEYHSPSVNLAHDSSDIKIEPMIIDLPSEPQTETLLLKTVELPANESTHVQLHVITCRFCFVIFYSQASPLPSPTSQIARVNSFGPSITIPVKGTLADCLKRSESQPGVVEALYIPSSNTFTIPLHCASCKTKRVVAYEVIGQENGSRDLSFLCSLTFIDSLRQRNVLNKL